MAGQKQEQTTTVPGRSAGDQAILDLLQGVGTGATGQLGDLGQLASGKGLNLTEEDLARIQEIVSRTGDMARREIGASRAQSGAALDESLAARGVQGASIESVDRALLEREFMRQLADVTDRSQIQAAEAGFNVPLQRAALQISANQALLERLTGSLGPGLQYGLQERLAQPSTTVKTPTNWAGLAGQLGGAAAGFAIGGPAGASMGSQLGGSLGGGAPSPGGEGFDYWSA